MLFADAWGLLNGLCRTQLVPAFSTTVSTRCLMGWLLSADALADGPAMAENTIRGAIDLRFHELQRQQESCPGSLPFNGFIALNISNPQEFGQRPITFYRQVLSCLLYPQLLDANPPIYPNDVVRRARLYLSYFPDFGAYSTAKGIEPFRAHIAEFYSQRDALPVEAQRVYLTDGISGAFHIVCELILQNKGDGFLVPMPLYPLYSATICRWGGRTVHYDLNDGSGFSFSIDSMKLALKEFREANPNNKCRSVVVIDPGNPSGILLTTKEKEEILRFCEEEGLVLIADEVYRENIYLVNAPFESLRKVAGSIQSSVEMFTLYSTSKGLIGECGARGGVIILDNIDTEVEAILAKMASVHLCPNTLGQAMIMLAFDPPHPDEESYSDYQQERAAIFHRLHSNAVFVHRRLSSMEGISCPPINVGMAAFPRIDLPGGFIESSKKKGVPPDLQFCMDLLEATGVVTVPGSGFGQRQPPYRFRLTILESHDRLMEALGRLETFVRAFRKEWNG